MSWCSQSKSLELPEGNLAKDGVSKRLENWSWKRLGPDVSQLELGTYRSQLDHPFTPAFLKMTYADRASKDPIMYFKMFCANAKFSGVGQLMTRHI